MDDNNTTTAQELYKVLNEEGQDAVEAESSGCGDNCYGLFDCCNASCNCASFGCWVQAPAG